MSEIYRHQVTKDNETIKDCGKSISILRESLIKIDGREILVFESQHNEPPFGKFTVIPGYCLRYKYASVGYGKQAPISEIEPISDDTTKKDLELALNKKSFSKPFNFW